MPKLMTEADASTDRLRMALLLLAVAALAAGLAAAPVVCAGWWRSPGPGALGLGAGLMAGAAWSRRRWRRRLGRLAREVAARSDEPGRPLPPPEAPELAPLVRAADRLRGDLDRAQATLTSRIELAHLGDGESGEFALLPILPLTRSGFLSLTASSEAALESGGAGDPSHLEMVSRLEPGELRWLESSAAEQEFLGWSLAELRRKTFLEIVHPDDRALARTQLLGALARGEAHGLVYRIKTARGAPKAIEMNVSVRYAPDLSVAHLRCHVTDVTARVKASRELRRRTRELTRLNDQLRLANRELQELKDRYSDLYQNAPAMYFSLDVRANIVVCNRTLLETLGYRARDLIGRPYPVLLPPERQALFGERIREFLRAGHLEVESQWVKADGSRIDVWITSTAVLDNDGKILHSRSVAQDVTARRALEAELQEKNQRLARANAELQRRNRELDEFSYVVSHDLQEPLRTLIAFSDFLLKDCADRLDPAGQEYVRYLVDASRRMRALINDLLSLSRAGKVTGEFGPVALDEVLALVRADFAELLRTSRGEIRVLGPLPTVWGDRDRIGQLFGNLICNGLKYHRGEGPVVEVAALPEEDAASATLSVTDNGIGIDPQFHAKIFQIFRRLHPREEFEGTGAGLAICQKIVQAHGGRIWVESEPGRGATFFVTLPRLAAEAHRAIRTEVLHAP